MLDDLCEPIVFRDVRLVRSQTQISQGDGGGGKPSGDNACQSQALQLAIGQLRLLKSLQAELRERTQQWEDKRATEPAQRKALADETRRLASEQRQLIRLVEQLTSEPADPPSPGLPPQESEAQP